MKDLKQIQEFFSKPLNEEKEPLDIIDLAKVVKAVQQTGHPVTVLLVPKFNKIEVLTGMNAPDDMLFDLSNAVDSLGYGRNDIIIAGDSSNLSRREYSDIFRVNGGAKDYFEESVEEVTRYSGFNRNPEDPDSEPFNPTGAVAEFKEDLRALFGKFKGDLKNPEFIKGVAQIMNNWKPLLRSQLDEAKKKKAKKKDNRPIGKPMRSSSGGKAYKVYVKDPKTKKIKTVRFGSGGLRAKINDSKARAAFAKRHKCSTKKDRTKAGYWSCRLPRYAKLLGLKSSFSGFW